MPEDLFSLAVRTLMEPSVALARIVDASLEFIPSAEGAAVELARGESMVYVQSGGTLEQHVGLELPARGSLSGLSVEMGATLYCADSEQDPRVDRASCRRVGARSLVCVPLRSPRGNVGVLKVCSSRHDAFSDRDVAVLGGLSQFVAGVIVATSDSPPGDLTSFASPPEEGVPHTTEDFVERVLRPDAVADVALAREVSDVIQHRRFHMVFQPIVDVVDGSVVMSEALCRFDAPSTRTPDRWFADAWRVGLGAPLELAAADMALADIERLPDGCRMSLNVSPTFLEHPLVDELLAWPHPDRIVLEITEHVECEDFARTRQILTPLRERGILVSLDDAGSGYSSLQRLVALEPDIIKLDLELVRGIDHDPVRRSMARALVHFAADVGSKVVAEGVEAPRELNTLGELGVRLIQGFLIARPGDVGAIPESPWLLASSTPLL